MNKSIDNVIKGLQNFDRIEDTLEWMELNKGIVRYSGHIHEFEAEDFTRRLNYMMERGVKKCTVYLNSGGGEVYAALAMYDVIKDTAKKIKIECVVEGLAASAASMIFLQAFPVRKSRGNARFLLHEPSRFMFMTDEKTSAAQDNIKEMTNLTSIITGILSERMKMTPKQVLDLFTRKELWLSANEALKYRIIDAII